MHPRVAEASVFVRRDPRLGEAPWAYVVLASTANSPTEDELIAHCRQKLAAFKVPQRIEFVHRLPRTASGKILHRVESSSSEPSPIHDCRSVRTESVTA
jgi:acyl-coenzyme A synthetase/AMP-(fatty) acid ligase